MQIDNETLMQEDIDLHIADHKLNEKIDGNWLNDCIASDFPSKQ